MVIVIPPEYFCYCPWEHRIFKYREYLETRKNRKLFLKKGEKEIHVYRDNHNNIVWMDRNHNKRVKLGLIHYPLQSIAPKW